MEEKIISIIEKIRPYIQRDGGDVEFVKYEENIVYVKMHGACIDCVGIDDTLIYGVEAMIQEEIPEVKKVQLYGGENGTI